MTSKEKKLNKVVASAHTPPYKIHRYFARRPWNIFSEIIKTYSKKNEIILDPFMGGGVSVYEGLCLGRKVIGYDLNPLSKFIVESMLVNDISINDLDSAFEKINDYIKTLSLKIEDSDVLWSELTFKVKCNLCLKDTLLSNDNKIGAGKFKCINVKCKAHSGESTYLQPKNCTRLETIYLYAVVKNNKGEVLTKEYQSESIKALENHINFLAKLLKEKSINIPSDPIPLNWDRQLEDQLQKKNIITFQDLFTKKNLLTNLLLKDFINNLEAEESIIRVMRFVFSSSLRDTNIMSFTNKKWQSGKPTSWSKHAYWIPSQFCEVDISSSFSRAYSRFRESILFGKEKFSAEYAKNFTNLSKKSNVYLLDSSIKDEPPPEEFVDAIVTDPPYGSNVQYLELSHFWYVWNKDLYQNITPDFSQESISNRKTKFEGAKNMIDYEKNLYDVFQYSYVALKTGKTMTLTFNNKDMGAWLALLISIFRSGFEIKKEEIIFQDGVKNYKQTAHTKYKGSPYGDFIYTFKKPSRPEKDFNNDSIDLERLIFKVDSIFMKETKFKSKRSRDDLKLSFFINVIDSIESYSRNPFNFEERKELYSHFGKNYLKKIYE